MPFVDQYSESAKYVSESTTLRYCLGLNYQSYATKISDKYLIPFLLSLDTPIFNLGGVEKNPKFHLAGLNRVITEVGYNIIQNMFLPRRSYLRYPLGC